MARSPLLMISKRNGAVLERYRTAEEAADATLLPIDYIMRMARDKTVGKGSVFFRREDDWTGYEEYQSEIVMPVVVLDIKTSVVTWHASCRAACEHYFVSRSAVNKSVLHGLVVEGRYVFRRQKSTAELKEVIRHD